MINPNEAPVSGGSNQVGEVSGFRWTIFEYGTGQYGDFVELGFVKTKNDGTDAKPITNRLSVPTLDKVTKPFGGMTVEATFAVQQAELAFTLGEMVRGYGVSTEGIEANTIEELVTKLKALLPANVGEIEGRLVLGYKENGYKGFPNYRVAGADKKKHPFFSVNPEVVLCPLTPKLSLVETATVSTEVAEGDVATEEVSY
jgi:hypothetical protein